MEEKHTGERGSLFLKHQGNWLSTIENREETPTSSHSTQINSESVKDLHVRLKIRKPPGENVKETFQDIGAGSSFLASSGGNTKSCRGGWDVGRW